ncbi:hypothetical protein DMENIID0001_097300 [Sergentomyia squamirostris]
MNVFPGSSSQPLVKRIKGRNVKFSQRIRYVDYVESNLCILDPKSDAYDSQWRILSEILNKYGPPQKSTEQWQRNFRDWGYSIVHKKKQMEEHMKTHDGDPGKHKLAELELRMIKLWNDSSNDPWSFPTINKVSFVDVADNNDSSSSVCHPIKVENMSPNSDEEDRLSNEASGSSPPPPASSESRKASMDLLIETMQTYLQEKIKRDQEKSAREERFLTVLENISSSLLANAQKRQN